MDTNEFFSLLLDALGRNTDFMMMWAKVHEFPDVESAYSDYAAAMGKRPDELSTPEKRQAILDAILAAADRRDEDIETD